MIDSRRPPPSSLRKQGPDIRAFTPVFAGLCSRVLSMGCGVRVPAPQARLRASSTRYGPGRRGVAFVALMLAIPAHPSHAASVEDFYKGRTLSIIIGYSVGGGYDTYGRLLSRYLGEHIPGRPSVVPQNMPGAGSLKAANYIYGVAPKDGTAIATFGRTIPVAPLLTAAGATFDGTKFTWLGSISKDTSLCVTSS